MAADDSFTLLVSFKELNRSRQYSQGEYIQGRIRSRWANASPMRLEIESEDLLHLLNVLVPLDDSLRTGIGVSISLGESEWEERNPPPIGRGLPFSITVTSESVRKLPDTYEDDDEDDLYVDCM
jgi:hypothetical protein